MINTGYMLCLKKLRICSTRQNGLSLWTAYAAALATANVTTNAAALATANATTNATTNATREMQSMAAFAAINGQNHSIDHIKRTVLRCQKLFTPDFHIRFYLA